MRRRRALNADDPERSKAWRERNKEKVRAYDASRKEQAMARLKAWREANPDFKIRENHRRRARKRGELSIGIREKLIGLQRGKCAICRGVPKIWHLDHIVPLASGGTNTDDNVQMLCMGCNTRKGAKDPIEFMQALGMLC